MEGDQPRGRETGATFAKWGVLRQMTDAVLDGWRTMGQVFNKWKRGQVFEKEAAAKKSRASKPKVTGRGRGENESPTLCVVFWLGFWLKTKIKRVKKGGSGGNWNNPPVHENRREKKRNWLGWGGGEKRGSKKGNGKGWGGKKKNKKKNEAADIGFRGRKGEKRHSGKATVGYKVVTYTKGAASKKKKH